MNSRQRKALPPYVHTLHRCFVVLTVVWAIVCCVMLYQVTSVSPAQITELKLEESMNMDQRHEVIEQWMSDNPLDAYSPIAFPDVGMNYAYNGDGVLHSNSLRPFEDDESLQSQLKTVNAECARAQRRFWNTVRFLANVYGMIIVVALIAWRGPRFSFSFVMLAIAISVIPDIAENFIGVHNERIMPWTLPVFLPAIAFIVTAVWQSVSLADAQRASEWQGFWGGVVLTVLGFGFVASIFMMEGGGRVNSKGVIAIPLGIYLMAVNGWKLFKNRQTATSERLSPNLSAVTDDPTMTFTDEFPASDAVADHNTEFAEPNLAGTIRSWFWGLFIAILLGGASLVFWRVSDSESEGMRIFVVMLGPVISALTALVISCRLIRKDRPVIEQLIPFAVFCVGLVGSIALVATIIEEVG